MNRPPKKLDEKSNDWEVGFFIAKYSFEFKKFYAFFFAPANLIINRVASIRTTAMGSEIHTLRTKPAIIYDTKDTAATSNA